MFKSLPKRFNATTVVAILALVLATTGGAYAAGVIKITSIKQISKTVQNQLAAKAKGKQGLPGQQGPAGPAGAQGSAGPAGKEGANGTNGKDGVSVTSEEIKVGEPGCTKLGGVELTTVSGKSQVCNGKAGKEGPEGQPWTPNNTLPKGATETGTWSVEPNAAKPLEFVVASFTVKLEKALTEADVHLINESGEEVHFGGSPTTPTKCGSPVGTAAEPKAESGNLCIYETVLNEAETGTEAITDPSTGGNGASTTGALLLTLPTGTASGHGTWAVTG